MYHVKVKTNCDPENRIGVRRGNSVNKIFTDKQEKNIVDYTVKCSQMLDLSA